MATRPMEPTLLGKFFDYPQDAATGHVLPYWLASSPGSGHCVRMTGACKRAFLATIEAVIERALVPANCDTTPDAQTDFRNMALNNLNALVGLGAWANAQNRAGFGARMVRGCPKGDWDLLVSLVARLWSDSGMNNSAGHVYAWQMEKLDCKTNGFIDTTDWGSGVQGWEQIFDISAWPADHASSILEPPTLRPWGPYPGGELSSPVSDWVSYALENLGVSVDPPFGTWNNDPFAESQLNGSPAPLLEGHEGNWFGSSSGAIVGSWKSARRSSSAWAVLQAMLANMRFTHLRFPFEVVYDEQTTTRTIERIITMDDDGNIVVVENVDATISGSGTTTNELVTSMSPSFNGGISWIWVEFKCANNELDMAPLVKFSNPGDEDGWYNIGESLTAYLSLGKYVHVGAATLDIYMTRTTGVDQVTVAGGHSYPADGFAQYVESYGKVTFVDKAEHYGDYTMGESSPDREEYSVRGETGDRNLHVPVRSHAQWLLDQLPQLSFPNIPANPGILRDATRRFWNGWEVRYPTTPNVRFDGRDAFFPIAFRNNAFVDVGSWNITLTYSVDPADGEWVGGCGDDPNEGAVFGMPGMAFPNLDLSSYSWPLHRIVQTSEAMAAYQWKFKAMPAE